MSGNSRWLLLGAFAANAFMNSLMFMDYNTVPEVSEPLFGECTPDAGNATCTSTSGDNFVTMTYAASLFAVLPAVIPVLMHLETKNMLTTGIGMFCQFLGAWLRWYSCKVAANGHSSAAQAIALFSSVLIGFFAAVMICSYSLLSHRWFPPQEQTMATTLAVMANYAGWCVGCLIFPYGVSSQEDLTTLMLAQAILASFAFAAFMCFHKERPEGQEAEEHEPVSLAKTFGELRSDNQFLLQCLCHGTLAGVSFAVPGFNATVLGNMNLSSQQSAWINFAFVLPGVIIGTALGRYVNDPKSVPLVLRIMYGLTSAALLVLVILVEVQDKLSDGALYGLIMICMIVSGGASLGFIGLALSAVVQQTYPVNSEFSGGAVEWLVQLWGGVFTFLAPYFGEKAFVMIGVPTWIATVAMFTMYDQEFKKDAALGEGHDGEDKLHKGLLDEEQP